MSAVREHYVNIVGVDTHARTNTYAILVAATGEVVDISTFPTSPPGLKRAIAWIDRCSPDNAPTVGLGHRRQGGQGSEALDDYRWYGCHLHYWGRVDPGHPIGHWCFPFPWHQGASVRCVPGRDNCQGRQRLVPDGPEPGHPDSYAQYRTDRPGHRPDRGPD